MPRFVIDNFREELRKMLGLLPSTVKLAWEKGFEEFLATRRKRMKVPDPGQSPTTRTSSKSA